MTTAPSPDCSVVICAYTEDRFEQMREAVASVQTQSKKPHEIIVVIDHNTELLTRTRDALPTVTVLENRFQRGLSGARNTGWRAASSDIVAFLDDDASADPQWLEHLLTPYDNPAVVGVGGRIEPLWEGGKPDSFPDEFLWVVGCSYRGLPIQREVVRNMIGANMSVRRTALDVAGGFDTDLGRVGTRPVGCEETELCLRISDLIAGSKIIYEPAALVHHHVSRQRRTWSYFRDRCFAEGLSKAHVRRVAAADEALDTEWTYVRRTLPSGVLRALRESATQRQPRVALRGAGIAIGLGWTSAGYAMGTLRGVAPTSSSDTPKEPEECLAITT